MPALLQDRYQLEALLALPIVDKEVLNLAHTAPIVISVGRTGAHAAVLVHPRLLRQPVLANGRWRGTYKPLAIRALPFFPIDPATGDWASMRIDGVSDGAREGSSSSVSAQTAKAFELLVAGGQRLQTAAEALLAADLLTPLEPPPIEGLVMGARQLMMPDPERSAALTPMRLTALAREGLAALDLLTASLFSRRLLAEGVLQGTRARMGNGGHSGLADPLALALSEPWTEGVEGLGVDASPLFRFSDLVAVGEPKGKR